MQETQATEQQSTSVVQESGRYKTWSFVLGWISIALLIIVIGLGAWIVLADDSAQQLTTEQEQSLETIDAYLAAWNAGDGAAADALMNPNGYLEDIGGRWYVADGSHARYLETVQSMGFTMELVDTYAMGNIVLVTYRSAEGGNPSVPNVYYMSPDGTQIHWVIDPYPPSNP
jgi:hypothetical protein